MASAVKLPPYDEASILIICLSRAPDPDTQESLKSAVESAVDIAKGDNALRAVLMPCLASNRQILLEKQHRDGNDAYTPKALEMSAYLAQRLMLSSMLRPPKLEHEGGCG